MDLWIRSQDKEELQKINSRLFIRKITNLGYSITNDLCVDDGFVNLGTYETKERALEVLDEINEKICLLQSIELAKGNDITLVGFKNAIGEEKLKGLCFPYEMPKE